MVLKSIPALNLIEERHAQAAAVPAAGVVDGLEKSVAKKWQRLVALPFL
jgi:hypothetical protein